MMKIIKFFIFLMFILNLNLSEVRSEELKIKIAKNLRCLICQGQSVYDSDAEFSNSVKILIEQKLNEGLSENEIYTYLKNKYGEWIVYDPAFNKNTYFLWILPLLMFVFGGAIIFKIFFFKKN